MQSLSKKTAFLFPGQGVLPHDICEYYVFLKSKNPDKTGSFIDTLQGSLDEINPKAKFNAEQNLANEIAPSWDKTDFVQPLIYTLSILTHELVNVEPAYVMGHSLGALTALTAAGSITFEQGTRIVAARGKFMQEESEKTNNGMCAIIGLTEDNVREICEKTKTVIALINAPTAFVVGGPRSKFLQIEAEATRLGARKTIRLAIPGAFHTRLMMEAYDKFRNFIKDEHIKKPTVPIVTNMQGISSLDPVVLKNDIIDSMINPVNWARMMNFLKTKSVDSYIEFGPGTSLISLSRINGVEREKVSHARSILE